MGDAIHILRYGTVADQKDILASKQCFDYLAINANMVAHRGSTLARYMCQELRKPYFIDPITYAFQRKIHLLHAKPNKEEVGNDSERPFKESILKLVENYQTFDMVIKQNRSIEAQCMEKVSTQRELCEEVMEFQLHGLTTALEKDEMMDYLQYESDMKAQSILKSLEPVWIVAPYFYLDVDDETWLTINISLCEIMCQLKIEKKIEQPIMAQLLLSKEVLTSKEALRKIVERYSQLPCDGYLIWVDDFEEIQSRQEELYGLLQLLKGLAEKPKYNMYGGFFSILLTSKEIGLLEGVSHGLEYGEARKAFPFGGGIPSSKYYFLPLHERLHFQESFRLLERIQIINSLESNWGEPTRYFREICGCPKCKELLKEGMIGFNRYQSREFYEVHYKTHTSNRIKAGKETKENCRAHYLACKQMEFYVVKKKKLDELLLSMEKERQKYELLDEKNVPIQYLQRWENVLESARR